MSTIRRISMLAFVTVLALAISVATADRAEAHVDLVSSSPEHGTTLPTLVDVIDLAFSNAAVPAGEGILLVDGEQNPVPATVTQPTDDTVRIVPNEPLDEGVFGVAWTMKAGDAHPRTGSITFRVEAAAGGAPSDGTATADAEAAPEPLPDLGLNDEPSTTAADWLARVGTAGAMLGALIGIGAFAFAATSLIGTKREVLEAAFWVRRGGALVVAGTFLEVGGTAVAVAHMSGLSGALTETISGAYAVAVLLRIVGGIAMVSGTSLRTREAGVPAADVSRLPVPRLGGRGVATIVAAEQRTAVEYRLDIHADAAALAGLVAVAASFLFDGHTATAEPSFIVRTASLVHVIAAGVWLGGVVLMAQVLARRRRAGVQLRAAPIVLRFSVMASVALAAVGIAGLALTWTILDGPSELWMTSWGRLLLVKVTMVGIAAALGAYNHFVIVPMLESGGPSHERASAHIAKVIRFEGAILLAVVFVTAVLVGAAS